MLFHHSTGKHMHFKVWERLRAWLGEGKKYIILAFLLITALFILGRLIDIDRYLQIAQKWVWSLGPWGAFAYIGIYIAATLFLLPGTPFTLLAAFLFGSLRGYLVMVAATTLASVAGFLIARYLAKEAVERRLSGMENFSKLKAMLEKNHWIAIPFVRLMPIFPFSINNYALGLTQIPFWSYLFFSELVLLPMNAVLIFGAGALYNATVKGEISWVLIGITTGAAFVVLALGYLAKRVFANADRVPTLSNRNAE